MYILNVKYGNYYYDMFRLYHKSIPYDIIYPYLCFLKPIFHFWIPVFHIICNRRNKGKI